MLPYSEIISINLVAWRYSTNYFSRSVSLFHLTTVSSPCIIITKIRGSRGGSVVLIRRNITFLLAFVFIIKVVKMSLWINYVRLGIQKSKHQNRNSAIVFSVSFLYLESILLIVIQKISCILFYAKFNFTCNKILQLILAWNINEMVSIYFEF